MARWLRLILAVPLIEVKRDVMAAQAGSCWGCLHVRGVALYLWVTDRRLRGWRLEIATPFHRVRWRRGAWRGAA